ncbi:MAG: hypothetical protein LH605_05595 [Microbacteriaceae bacterium]|nr:hypothetical protein [Microbacteriaceae bacterium]
MNRHDQDSPDWLTAQFSDDDDLDDENAGTDAADADAVDSTAPTAGTAPNAPDAPKGGPERATTGSMPEPVRREGSPVSTPEVPFTWGLRPTGSPAEPVAQPAPGAGATPSEREPDAVVPASFFPAPKAEQPTAPTAADPDATGSAPELSAAGPVAPVAARPAIAPNDAAPSAPLPAAAAAAPVSAAAAAAAAAAPVSAAAAAAPTQPARPFYPPPPAISRTAQRDSEALAEPLSAAQPQADTTQADGATGSAMSIAEVLDAPSPRRAAREVAALEEAAREAATRDDSTPAQAGVDEPHDDGIDDLVDPLAPFTPQARAPLTPAFPVVPPEVSGAADPVRATGTARFDVPVVPTVDSPAVAGRAQSVANREASTKASSSRTQKILLLVGIVLVVALAIVLIFLLAQRADAATVTGALDAGVLLAEAVGLTRSF